VEKEESGVCLSAQDKHVVKWRKTETEKCLEGKDQMNRSAAVRPSPTGSHHVLPFLRDVF
jgi:hypothetical protein